MSISISSLFEKTAYDSKRWNLDTFRDLANGPLIISFLNAHAVTTASRKPEFKEFLGQSDFLLRDGIGVKIGMKIFGLEKTENLNGTDLITVLLDQLKEKSLAIFGASEETMAVTKAKLESNGYDNIQVTHHGFHEDDFYLQQVKELKPDVVLLCMGMPRQELLAQKLSAEKYNGVIICGGGWADFYSGVKPRAPKFMRKLALEWLYRLMREPMRLGKRYTIDILDFFRIVLLERMKGNAPNENQRSNI